MTLSTASASLARRSLTGNELMAALELGYLLRLVNRGFNERMLYISRSGFFTSTELPKNAVQAQTRYTHAIAARGLPGNRSGTIPVAALSGKPFSMSTRKTTSGGDGLYSP
jgi:hypothetical protein